MNSRRTFHGSVRIITNSRTPGSVRMLQNISRRGYAQNAVMSAKGDILE